MTELEVVNMLLRLIGSSPISSLQSPHPDAVNAKTTIDRIRKQVQDQGWWFNTDYNIKLTPNSDREIKLAKSVSAVKTQTNTLVQRGDKLYNRDKQTYKFDQPVTVDRIVRVLDWEQMPATMQSYCAYFAAAEFIRDELEDPTKQANLEESAARALIAVNAQELDEGHYNIFTRSRVRRARVGFRPYGRGYY